MLKFYVLDPAARQLLAEFLNEATVSQSDREERQREVEEQGGAPWIMTAEEYERYLEDRQLI